MPIDEFPAEQPLEGQTKTTKSNSNWRVWGAVSVVPFLFFAVILFSSISSGRVDPEKMSRVTMGMSEQEVRGLLGPPSQRRPGTASGTSMTGGSAYETCVWYAQDGGVLELTFGAGGKIVAISKTGR